MICDEDHAKKKELKFTQTLLYPFCLMLQLCLGNFHDFWWTYADAPKGLPYMLDFHIVRMVLTLTLLDVTIDG